MEYYLQLAREQEARYQAFYLASSPYARILDIRHAFFGQAKEMDISVAILVGLNTATASV